MFLKENLENKWGPLLDHKELPAIGQSWRRTVTGILLENQETEARKAQQLNEDAPVNQSGTFPNATNLKGYDPILIALVRRSMPNLMAFDVCGVQPMSGPTGLIFAMRSKYTSQGGDEALYNEANTSFSAAGFGGSHTGTSPAGSNSTNYTAATGMTTLQGEGLGTSGNTAIPEMSFSIDKVTATAVTRALKAEYTVEIAQDLKAIHNIDAETELANILSAEILAEINREVVRKIGFTAVAGGAQCAVPGVFDMDVDANGRWSVEKFKGLFYQIEREANAIAKSTRRGKGNILITSADVASALVAADLLDSGPSKAGSDLSVDDTGSTYAGTLMGRYKVYIDPYAPIAPTTDYFVVGYKGASAYDAGFFYCPYVPLQMYRAVHPGSFVPVIGFKTRYAMVANPFCKLTGVSDGSIGFQENVYYRKVSVANLF